jgi:hypothetical protein
VSVSDIGAYCRAVEEHLTKVNGGHLVRIVGAGFELVRGWAVEGIPLSVVYHAIESKAERHDAGRAKRPLRIEFCESDVRETFDRWRRAVGLWSAPASEDASASAEGETGSEATSRKASLTKQLDRAIERLSRAGGRLDQPEGLRDAIASWLETLSVLREEARGARGPVKDALVERLPSLDDLIKAGARESASPALVEELRREAEQDLESFRGRLAGDAWQRALDATVDRLLRDRLGLPSLV